MKQTFLAACSALILCTGTAMAQGPLTPDFKDSLTNAKGAVDVMRAVTAGTGPVTASICTQPDWDQTARAIATQKQAFAGYGLHPSTTGGADQGIYQLFAWGPSIDDTVEALNTDLGYLSMHFWITVELLDHGTHRSVFCRYAALESSAEAETLPAVAQMFKAKIPGLAQTADRSAPMLHQEPDVLRVEVWQTPDRATSLELRAGGTRIDVVLRRQLEAPS